MHKWSIELRTTASICFRNTSHCCDQIGLLYFKQELLTFPEHLNSPPVFSGVRVTRSLVLCVCFVDRCLFFCTFFFWPLCCLLTSLGVFLQIADPSVAWRVVFDMCNYNSMLYVQNKCNTIVYLFVLLDSWLNNVNYGHLYGRQTPCWTWGGTFCQ